MSMSRIMRPGIDLACPRCSTVGISYFHDEATCLADWGPNEQHRPLIDADDALALWSRNDRGFHPEHSADGEAS